MEGYHSVKLFITLLNEPVDKKCYIPPIIPYPAMAGPAWPNIGPCGARYVNWEWWNATFQLSRISRDLRATGQTWINHFRVTECSNKPTILIVISFYCVSARAEPSLLDQRKHKLPLPTQHGLFSLFIFILTLGFI